MTAQIERRGFLAMLPTGSLLAGPLLTEPLLAAPRQWRVAIVGHTGRGNYGHGLDIAFRGVPNVSIVALSDPDDAGRAKAMARSGAAKGYSDFREMLRIEKPDIAVIGPRWLDQRVAMVEAASDVGVHMLMEKAFAATLEDADQMLRTIGDRKVQVCHTARLAPATREGLRLIREGAIGEVLELRARGKEDHRAGGEDMLTLGTHCFDLMRLIAGNPLRCAARVDGPQRQPTEMIGPVAGERIHASFEFEGGVTGTFDSRKNSGPHSHRYGVTVFGSTGAVAFPINEIPNGAWIVRSPSWRGEWEAVDVSGAAEVKSHPEVNTLFARDLLAAIEEDRAPACSAVDGLWTIEMVQAVYAASIARNAVELPLKQRRHPLL